MKQYVVHNAAGEIIRAGICQDEELLLQVWGSDEFLVEGVGDPATDAVDVATGEVVPGGKPTPPEPPYDYRAERAAAYPSIADQLDMLWSAMDENPGKRLEPFYSRIKAVKEAYPKDGQARPGKAIIYGVEGL